ncbi:RNA-guided endonuclease InsQ/TnpB family protein [Methylobacterium pseudosasicola]|uniref:Putative transposase n=1 Tax=Methylobacterium pseudosasicola TaxID=582667 RepID=A0A1I4U0B7_9HYPH|nr:RNA-guided endonuclease TnpB family protein [Methylobacterium pseudosasicola]SFM82456.1 putative transposase [Methylobacterium pseudosasicola]
MCEFNRGFRYRLVPTVEQDHQLRAHAGVCRFIYNIALEQRRDWWRNHKKNTGKSISLATQSIELTQIRKEFEWVADVTRTCLDQVLRDLDRAYTSFFAGKTQYPTMRRKGVNDSFRFKGDEVTIRPLNAKWSLIRLPKIGWVKFRASRQIEGIIRNVTVSNDALGWHVSLACRSERSVPAPSAEIVGIDRGVATTLALSTGELLTMPASLERIEVKKRKAQRILARRKRGSNRRRKAQARVAQLKAKQARIRRDFHHRAALSIANRFGVAVLENLNTRSMTASAKGSVSEPGINVQQKSGLNRGILNAGWHQFATILAYKCEERGGQVVTVPARFTSQTCAACGVIDARSRESQARFRCVGCGHDDHADVNAAINIKRRWSTPLLDVEGSRCGPVEASIGGVQ